MWLGPWSQGFERQREPKDEKTMILCAVPHCPHLHRVLPAPATLEYHCVTPCSPCFLPATFLCFWLCQWALEREYDGRKDGDWIETQETIYYNKIWTVGHQRSWRKVYSAWEMLTSGNDGNSTHKWKFLRSWNPGRSEEEEIKPWIKTPRCYPERLHKTCDLIGWDESCSPRFREERITETISTISLLLRYGNQGSVCWSDLSRVTHIYCLRVCRWDWAEE